MIKGVTSVMQTNQVPELELLPPNQKFMCGDCGKNYRHVNLCKDGKKRCGNCKRKLVTNIFYVPHKKAVGVGKFSMSFAEKQILGIQKSNKVQKWLDKVKKEKTRHNSPNEKKKALEKSKEINKNFLEGLGLLK